MHTQPDGIVYDFYRNLISTSAIAVYQSEFYCPTYLCAHSKMSPLVASVALKPIFRYRTGPLLPIFGYMNFALQVAEEEEEDTRGRTPDRQFNVRCHEKPARKSRPADVKIYRCKLLPM